MGELDDTSEATGEAPGRHTIPVIDRMMEVLGAIERRPSGPTIRELTAALGLPRTSVYRILNTLQLHDMVHRDPRGGYHLGRRLLELAARVAAGGGDLDLASFCQPYLDRLAAEVGEGIKLSVLDADGVLVLAVAQGRRDYALTSTRGQHLPAHAGAAGKLLLAYLAAADLDRRLAAPLAHSPRARSPTASACAASSRASGRRAGRRTRARTCPRSSPTPRRWWGRTAAFSRRSACPSSRARRRSAWR